MMRAQPYDDDIHAAISRSNFLSDLRQILQQNHDLAQHLTHTFGVDDQITTTMETIRSASLESRTNIYQSQRVDEQRIWYAKKAGYNKRMTKRWFIAMFGFQLFALASVLVRIAYPDWHQLPTEVLAAAAAAVLSWMQVKRFQELLTSYNLAAQEIGIVKGELQNIGDESHFATFVGDAENAFSREHTQWRARRDT